MYKLARKILKTKLVKDFFIYASFSTFQKLIPFVLLPFFSRYMTQEQLGYYLVYQAIVLIAMPVMTLNVETSISVNYYYLKIIDFAKYLTCSICFAGFLSLSVLLIVFIFGDNISYLLNFPFCWLLIALLSIYPQFIYNIRQILFRYKNQPNKYGLFAVITSIVNNGLGVFLYIFTSLTWEAFVLGYTIGYFLMAFFSLIMLNSDKFINFTYSSQYIKDAIKTGCPVGLHVIGSWLSNSLNRILLNTIIGTAATASYGIGATFGMIMTLIQDSINLAYTPFLYEKLKNINEDSKYLLVKVGVLIYCMTIFSAVLISVIGYWGVGVIFGETYLTTRSFIMPLVLSSAINGFYKVHAAYIFYSKKTFIIARITIICGLLNIVLSYCMINNYGLLGAAYSVVFIQTITYILIMISVNNIYHMNWFYFIKFMINRCLILIKIK